MSSSKIVTRNDLRDVLNEIVPIMETSIVNEAEDIVETVAPDIVEDYVSSSAFTSAILDVFYPVGCYYHTSDTTFNPNTSWGGTWSKVTEGYFLQATETAADVGNTVSAGLPNITGYTFQRSTNYNTSNITWTGGGALAVSNDTTGTADGVSQVNGAVARKRIDFNASSSNSIYGNSTTVQPPAILVYIWHRTA